MNRALLAAAATGVQVGAALVASRAVVHEVGPASLALVRYALGFACLLPFAWPAWKEFRGEVPAKWRSDATNSIADGLPLRDVLVMAALGIGQFAVLIALLNWALQHIGAARAAMVFSLFPLMTLCLSTALGRERFSWQLLGGVLLSVAGVALALADKLAAGSIAAAASDIGHWWGELAVLAAAAVGAVCSVLYRPYLQRYPTVCVSALAMLASVGFLAMLAWPEAWVQHLPRLGLRTWAIMVFVGVSSGVGYFWWLYALKHETPARVTVFLALNPLTATLLGGVFLAEAQSRQAWAALALIAAALWLATRPQAPR